MAGLVPYSLLKHPCAACACHNYAQSQEHFCLRRSNLCGKGGRGVEGGAPTIFIYFWMCCCFFFGGWRGKGRQNRGDRAGGGACLLPTVPGARNDKSAEDEGQILFTRLGGGEGGGEGGRHHRRHGAGWGGSLPTLSWVYGTQEADQILSQVPRSLKG